MSSVVVVGIGAMGGGMARALLDSSVTSTVTGYDKNLAAVETFYRESVHVNKNAGDNPPVSLKDAILLPVDFVILSLVNESQCEAVCFGETEQSLVNIMEKGSCVILTSTVTATWARTAGEKFRNKGIFFVDCPVSGGPTRAREGDLTMMASGDDQSLGMSEPLLNALGRDGDVHIIDGGAGAGSTVKCVHQLLAGVHICVAAEAMAMAAKAGLDVEQLYRIVNGAAGASWMFTDRGKRMLEIDPEVKSALNIFVKDLGIVYEESKKLQVPIPIASTALQQFISGQSLGLGGLDDSQVVKVYENVTKVPVAGHVVSKESNEVVFSNDHVKVYQSKTDVLSENDITVNAINKLTIHLKIASVTIQILNSPPNLKGTFDFDESTLEDGEATDQFQVYKQNLEPGDMIESNYPFFYLTIAASHGTLEQKSRGGPLWTKTTREGDVEFKEPSGQIQILNSGMESFARYIVRLS
ncbi:NADP-dependent 3-hydroxyisobutyrate dehydrogenase related protein [Nitzschia inconspicua]|uniref:NADP-dependent 3-hydroxyisobutyrate dehydrogenase related protein n=1 Tax=Nitzschia inconspicua TaxID=303405 RepID=A0A9K3L6Q1_9STRA|nr:NADP-dependent 3-hydroxyisobutyrate dehydrogenase related protein [Nitzschia inconspicua]